MSPDRARPYRDLIRRREDLLQEGSIIFTPETEDTGHLTLASTNSSETVFVYSKIHSHLFENWYLEQRTVVSLNFGQLHRAIRSVYVKHVVEPDLTRRPAIDRRRKRISSRWYVRHVC